MIPRCSLQEADERNADYETVTYQEVLDEFRGSNECFFEKYCFDQIKAAEVSPQDDLEAAIATHAKIKLQRGQVYCVRDPLVIRACAYVIGNGAIIRIETPRGPGIKICALAAGPSISGMWGVTFVQCKFERAAEDKGLLIRASTHVLLHGCMFSGIMGTCIELDAGGIVRGCQFVACYRGVCSMSNRDIKVRQCYFEKCIFGITSRGDFRICGNISNETYCFAHLEGEGVLKNNQVRSPNKWTNHNGFSMVTCADGQVVPLGSVHVVANKHRRWPVIAGNVFVTAKVYLGNRMGTVSLPQCAFYLSGVCADQKAASKLVLASSFDNGISVHKVLRRDETCHMKMCLCGASHYTNGLVFGDITAEVTTNRNVFTVDSAEFTSDED